MTAEQDELRRDHVLRAVVPWRTGALLTECGQPATDDMPVLTLAEFLVRVRQLGKTRAVMITCITCWKTAVNHHADTWESDPVAVVAREVTRAQYRAAERRQFRDELTALAELAARHPDEFAGLVTGLAGTARLDDRRRKRAARSRGAS